MGGYFNIFSLKQAVAVVICNLLSLCLASAWVPTWPSWSHFGSFGPYKAPEFLIHLRAGAAGSAHLPQAQSNRLLCHSGRGSRCLPRSPGTSRRPAYQSQGLPLPPGCQDGATTSQSLNQKGRQKSLFLWAFFSRLQVLSCREESRTHGVLILPSLFTFPPRCLQR